jgi:hypothetical protein
MGGSVFAGISKLRNFTMRDASLASSDHPQFTHTLSPNLSYAIVNKL